MADRKIDIPKAQAWQKEVKEEIASVRLVLEEITNVCSDMPNKDDTIVQMIEKTGSFLDTSWKKTTKVFDEAADKVGSAIKDLLERGNKILDELDNFGKSIN